DLLDAAVAAWTARRYIRGEARPIPDPPEVMGMACRARFGFETAKHVDLQHAANGIERRLLRLAPSAFPRHRQACISADPRAPAPTLAVVHGNAVGPR
ncbi:MAG: DUF429 domain-containing protein, partial [Mycobacterium sp.]